MPRQEPEKSRSTSSFTLIDGFGVPKQAAAAQPDARQFLRAEYGVELPPDCPAGIPDEVVRIVTTVWLDGRIIPKAQFHIDPCDDGLLCGRGVWECTRVFRGVPWLWPAHLDRLERTAKLLGIAVDPARFPSSEQVTAFVRALTSMDVVVRLNVSAGVPDKKPKPGAVWMTATLPPAPMASIRLKSCLGPVVKGQPQLVWKTFQYGGRLLAGQQAVAAGFDSALLLDAEGNVLEAAHANIFVRLPEGWVTPPSDGELLPGTVRQHVLQHAPFPTREKVLPLARVREASEAFLTNSNVGMVPVAQIDDVTFAIGTETKELQRWLIPGQS